MPGEDEPLHAYVTAGNPESVKKAVDKVGAFVQSPLANDDFKRCFGREFNPGVFFLCR